jgi:CHAT domain-containing protein
MSDVYNMVRLSSTRELALNKKQTSNTRVTVYGGISYTLDKETMQTESRRYASQERSIDADTLNRGTVIDLPATLDEAKYIDSLLVANNITTTLFTSEKANEESFKSLSGKGNRILHIATHGFTWTDSIARKQDYFASRIQMIGDNLPKGPVIDPLNRCGLLFAGANTAYQGRSKDLPEGVQDGILTAKEISLMDLRGTELVVLSACETAQGDITSEGVFGLQRAFKMAGVQTIIMSLWKVDDKVTKMFMSEFYKNWIEKKQSKREAFNNAKNTVCYAVNEYGDYIYKDKPYYWAGFIMLD